MVGALGVAVALVASVGAAGIAESQVPSSTTTTTSAPTSTVPDDGTALDAAAIDALLREIRGGLVPTPGVSDPDYFAMKALLEVFGTRFAGTWGPDRIRSVGLTSLQAGDDAAALEALQAAAGHVGPVDEVRLIQQRYSLVELNETRRLVERVVRSFRTPPRGVGYGIDPIDNRVEVGIDPDDATRPEVAELYDYADANPDRLVITLERLCPVAGGGSAASTVPTSFPECGGADGSVTPAEPPTPPGAAVPARPIAATPSFTG